jgi:4-carboxymuconolactone decarboxylase
MAHAFTPQLTVLVDNPLFSDVWADPALSPRDRSIATVAALVALYRPEQLPAHLRRACDNGVTRDELAALITHVAFYAGFPAAISASAIAARTLTEAGTKDRDAKEQASPPVQLAGECRVVSSLHQQRRSWIAKSASSGTICEAGRS